MIIKKRISELPISQDFHGLKTIGTDASNKSVAVSLDYLQQTADGMEDATKETEAATRTAQQAAENATRTAQQAAEDAKVVLEARIDERIAEMDEATALCRHLIEEAASLTGLNLVPESLSVSYPKDITLGNKNELRIEASLSPAYCEQNILYLGDSRAVEVAPNGRISVTGVGESVVHIIPSTKTSLFRSIRIRVHAPALRLYQASKFRLTSSGNIRFV